MRFGISRDQAELVAALNRLQRPHSAPCSRQASACSRSATLNRRGLDSVSLSVSSPTRGKPDMTNANVKVHCGEGVPIKREVELVIKRVKPLIDTADALIKHVRKGALAASGKVATCLGKRVEDLTSMRQQLELHIADTERTLREVTRALSLEEQRMASTAPSEGEVAAVPDEERRARQEHIMTLRDAKEDLEALRTDLVCDHRRKIAALEIDSACRRVTPQSASAAPPGGAAASGRQQATGGPAAQSRGNSRSTLRASSLPQKTKTTSGGHQGSPGSAVSTENWTGSPLSSLPGSPNVDSSPVRGAPDPTSPPSSPTPSPDGVDLAGLQRLSEKGSERATELLARLQQPCPARVGRGGYARESFAREATKRAREAFAKS